MTDTTQQIPKRLSVTCARCYKTHDCLPIIRLTYEEGKTWKTAERQLLVVSSRAFLIELLVACLVAIGFSIATNKIAGPLWGMIATGLLLGSWTVMMLRRESARRRRASQNQRIILDAHGLSDIHPCVVGSDPEFGTQYIIRADKERPLWEEGEDGHTS